MPDRDYQIQDRYGRRLTLTGDHEPTAAEQAQAFADAERAGILANQPKRVPLATSMFGSTGGPSYTPEDPQENLRIAASEAPMVIGAMTAPLTAGASLGPAMVAQGAIGGGSRLASNVVSGRPAMEGVIRDAALNAAFEGGGNVATNKVAPWLMRTGLRIGDQARQWIGSKRIADLALKMGIVRGEAGEAAATALHNAAEAAQREFVETGRPVMAHQIPGQVRRDIAPALAGQRTAGVPHDEPAILKQFERELPMRSGFKTEPTLPAGEVAPYPHPSQLRSLLPARTTYEDMRWVPYSPITVKPASVPAKSSIAELDAARREWSAITPQSTAEADMLNALRKRTGDVIEAANPGYHAGIDRIALADALKSAVSRTVGADASEAERLVYPLMFATHTPEALAAGVMRMPAAKRGAAVALNRGAQPVAAIVRAAILSQLGNSEPGGETLPERVARGASEWAARSALPEDRETPPSHLQDRALGARVLAEMPPPPAAPTPAASHGPTTPRLPTEPRLLRSSPPPAAAPPRGSRLLDPSTVGRVLSELPPTPAGGSSKVFTPNPEDVASFNAKLARVRQRMADAGYPMQVTSRTRTTAEQQRLYRQGRETPGRIVTDADGVIVPSHHQTGTAADLVFIQNGRPSYSDKLPWALLGKIAKEEGLEWGGDWKDLVDRPHVQLPAAGQR